jgi:hypothetical protein
MPPWNESNVWGMGARVNFGSLGPFTFYPGQKVSLDIVIGASWSDTTNLAASSFHNDIANIRTWFSEGTIPIGIEELAEGNSKIDKNRIRVYPNPVSGNFLLIDYENTLHEKIRYRIFDSQGRQILLGSLSEKSTNRISLEGITKGVYLIKLTGNHTNQQASFIKM